jgi:glutaconate CoA-transferase subunit B
MRLPLLAFHLAKSTHAPHAIGIFENGILRDEPAGDVLFTMGDNPNIEGAIWTTSMMDIMALLQNGQVTLGFIGGAEVDRFGNLNTTYIGGRENIQMRLPGSGGGSDIASLSKRVVILMNHEKRRFLDKVSYLTSPGFGEGGDWRKRKGLKGGGPSAVITTKGIFRFDSDTHEMILDSLHPGINVEEVLQNTGWALKLASNLKKTKPPTRSELRIIRKYDAHGFWTRGNRRVGPKPNEHETMSSVS